MTDQQLALRVSTKRRLLAPSIGALCRTAGISLAIGIGVALIIMALPSLRSEAAAGKDLVQEYDLARALLDGTDPYSAGYLTAHPPTAGLLFLPFALLNYPTAAAIWFGLEVGFLALSVYLLTRAAGARLSPLTILAIWGALMAWHPVVSDLTWGQLSLAQLPLLAGSWWALRNHRQGPAGALLGVSLLIKPFLWPLALLFLLYRDWRLLRATAVTLALGYGITLWRIGLEAHVTYVTQTLPVVDRMYRAHFSNISLWSLGWRVFDGTGFDPLVHPTAPPLVPSPQAAQIVSALLPLLTLLAGCLAIRRLESREWAFGLMICVSLLVSPIAWTHYLVLVLIPATQLLLWLRNRRFPRRESALSLLAVGLLLLPQAVTAQVVGDLFGVVPVPGATQVAFPMSMAQMEPSLGLLALAWLVAALGARRGSAVEAG